MKNIIILIAVFIIGCSGGDTTNQPETQSFSEGSPVTINIEAPECESCQNDIENEMVYNKIIALAKMFLEKLEKQSSDSSISIKIINDLVSDAVTELNEGTDSQEVLTDFESSLDNLELESSDQEEIAT